MGFFLSAVPPEDISLILGQPLLTSPDFGFSRIQLFVVGTCKALGRNVVAVGENSSSGQLSVQVALEHFAMNPNSQAVFILPVRVLSSPTSFIVLSLRKAFMLLVLKLRCKM